MLRYPLSARAKDVKMERRKGRSISSGLGKCLVLDRETFYAQCIQHSHPRVIKPIVFDNNTYFINPGKLDRRT